MQSYAAREYLKLLEPIGILSGDTKKYAFHSEEAEKKMAEMASRFRRTENSRLVGISPGAGNKIKQWGGKKFAAVARYLIDEKDATVVILGGKDDRADVEEMKRTLGQTPSCLDAAEKLDIDELKALISKLDLFISVDTGPIYIAESFGIPTIDIVGPVDEREQPPMGEKHLIVKNRGGRPPQLFVMNGRVYDAIEAKKQIDDIEPERVIDAINQLMVG